MTNIDLSPISDEAKQAVDSEWLAGVTLSHGVSF